MSHLLRALTGSERRRAAPPVASVEDPADSAPSPSTSPASSPTTRRGTAAATKRRPPPPQLDDDILGSVGKIFQARCGDLGLKRSELGLVRFHSALERAVAAGDRLELRASGIGPAAAAELARALQRSRQRPWLIDLGGNMVGDEGATHFAHLLARSDSLVWLALSSNGISTRGGVALAAALRANRSLTALDLSSESNTARRNTIGRRGAARLPASTAAPTHPRPPGHRPPPARRPTTGGGATAPPRHRAAPPAPPCQQQLRPAAPPVAHGVQAWDEVGGEAEGRDGSGGEAEAEGEGEGEGEGGAQGGADASPSAEAVVALADALQHNPVLAILRLGGNALGADGAGLLAAALDGAGCALRELSVPMNALGAEGAERLAEALATSPTLRVVDLSANALGDRGVRAIGLSMAQAAPPAEHAQAHVPASDVGHALCGVVEVNLGANGLTAECAPALARGLARRPHFATLHLGRNALGDDGASALARCLVEGCRLRELTLSENGVGDAGAAALGEALASGCQLQRLDLSHSLLTNAGGTALAAGLATGRTRLHVLRLMWNQLGEAAGVALGGACGACASVHSVHLQHNRLAAKAADALIAAAAANPSLTSVGTEGNALPYASMVKLEEAASANRQRTRDAAPERAVSKLTQLQGMRAQLEAKRREYATLCATRAATVRRHRLLSVELDDTRAKVAAQKEAGLVERRSDGERLQAAKRGVGLGKSTLVELRGKWHSNLEALRRRRTLEEAKVRSLNEQFADVLTGLRHDESAAAARLAEADGEIEAARARADGREPLAEGALANLAARQAEVEMRPQWRKLVPPPPPRPTEEVCDRTARDGTRRHACTHSCTHAAGHAVPPSARRPPRIASTDRAHPVDWTVPCCPGKAYPPPPPPLPTRLCLCLSLCDCCWVIARSTDARVDAAASDRLRFTSGAADLIAAGPAHRHCAGSATEARERTTVHRQKEAVTRRHGDSAGAAVR